MAKIQISESKLRQIVNESVKKVLNEFNISSVYGHRRMPEIRIISNKLTILPSINEFISINFGEDIAEDFCDYLYDNDVYKLNVEDSNEDSFTIDADDYSKIINCIKQYPNKAIAKTVIDSFDEIIYNYDYDKDAWDTEWDYIDYSD